MRKLSARTILKAALVAAVLMVGVGVQADRVFCNEDGCTKLPWKNDAKSDCTAECDTACEGNENVRDVTDLQTNCQCYCSDAGCSQQKAAVDPASLDAATNASEKPPAAEPQPTWSTGTAPAQPLPPNSR